MLRRDSYQCQSCGVGQRYLDKSLYDDQVSQFIRYRGSNLRPYHLASPLDRPTIAHRTDEMVTLCFDCYWLDGGEEAPEGWRKSPYDDWRAYFE